ncbi:MAG TPA: ribbon-helix-helix protein, CopG family [Armatimonadota bacterium]|nr:ribbon-helix-helix protein, CopG family [Armatimonadota bacterium]
MVRYTIRMPDKLHEKIRRLAYQERRSQHEIMLEVLEKALAKVEVPEEANR